VRVTATNRSIKPPRWTPLKYHEKQAQAFYSKAKFVNLACGRGSGKTELARRKIVLALAQRKPWPDPLYFYALPTYSQAKKVAWTEILKLVPKGWLAEPPNLSELRIETIFGSKLYVLGMDKPQRIEGVQYDGGVVDEACDQKPHRKAWCWRVGVPKRVGTCSREFKETFDRGLDPDVLDTESYSWPTSDILSEEELQVFKQQMDLKDYREQYEASWEQAGGLIFFTFDPKVHVDKDLEICHYRSHLPLYIGMDFNVDPMCWVIGQVIPDHPRNPKDKTLVILDEIFIRNTNTLESLNELHSRFSNHRGLVYFCGDAASRQRRTSASLSDYMHITNSDKFPERRIKIPLSNPPIADRFSVTNAALLNADGQVRTYIHPKCKRLILDLTYRAYKEGTSEPNDSAAEGHITDALGYLMWQEFPMRVNRESTGSVLIRAF
jgi:hypothetical protein